MALDFCYLYVTQSDFTREEARLPMVEDIGGGGWWWWAIAEKTPAQRKSGQKI